MLSTFCGIEIKKVVLKPTVAEINGTNNRPEMRLFDAQLRLADAQEKALGFGSDAQTWPIRTRILWLSRPEYVRRHDERNWSWNGMIGARLTWNIGVFYTRKNDKAKIQLQRDSTENSRDVFLFNNNLEQIQQNENIARYKKLMADDDEIISLRTAVRKASESKTLAWYHRRKRSGA